MSTKHEFFSAERFALVGDSRSKKFPELTHKYLQDRGKTVYPVDLAGNTPGFLPSLSEVPDDAEAVIIEVAKDETAGVVEAALDRGFTKVWIHQMTDTPEAVALCEQAGVALETGGCAVMYSAPTVSPHALHRGVWKLIGRY